MHFMDIRNIRLQILSELEGLSYDEPVELLHQAADHKGFTSWGCAFIACEATGSHPAAALNIAASNFCMLAAIHLVDDMLDHEPGGHYQIHGNGATANLALAFQSIGFQLISKQELDPEKKTALIHELANMMLRTSEAQQNDTSAVLTEDGYWKLVEAKTPPLFSSALFGGALTGGSSLEVAQQIAVFGKNIGKLIQIGDDLTDVFKGGITPDWKTMSNSLPILFARIAEYENKERFNALVQAIETPGHLEEAREILVSCGAFSYCIYHMVAAYHDLQKDIAAIPLPQNKLLTKIPDMLIEPVSALARSLGLQDFPV
jgi:geranylgeranyl pyrophosphate synthase